MLQQEIHETPSRTGQGVAAHPPEGLAAQLRHIRKARNESQSRFWARFGVTQSRGSRFELGHDIPAPVAILLKLYFEGVVSEGDLWRARRGPLAIKAMRRAA